MKSFDYRLYPFIILCFLPLGLHGQESVPEPDNRSLDELPVFELKPQEIKPPQKPMATGKLIIEYPKWGDILPNGEVEVFISPKGSLPDQKHKRFHVILDNGEPWLHEDERKPIQLSNLSTGGHLLRVWEVDKEGLSISQTQAYAVVQFFVEKKDFRNFLPENKPYLTVNLPRGKESLLSSKESINFDFMIHHRGKNDEVHIRYSLGSRQNVRALKSPVVWEKLKPGLYRLVAELVGENDQPILGVFNRVERQFEVVRPVPVMKLEYEEESLEDLIPPPFEEEN